MRRAKGVIGALRAFGEPRQAVLLTDRQHAVTPPRQDFVRIALVADVPDQLVARGVKHGVNGDRHLNHAQTRAQVTARLGNRPDRFLAQLGGKAGQVKIAQALHVGGPGDPV